MPNWKKVVVSGSDAALNSLNVSTSLTSSGDFKIDGAFYDNNNTPGTSGQMLLSTATGIEWANNIAESAQDLIISGKNMEATTIPKGTPLYFSGSNTAGNIVGVYFADASDPDRMPAGGVAAEQLTSGQEGGVYIYGFINGVDTSAFAAGDSVFVGVGGGYTNSKPTGSALIQKLGNVEKSAVNGSGVIQGPSWYNDLPNWEEGKLKVGVSDGQPVTSSFVHLDEDNQHFIVTGSLTVSGSSTFTNIGPAVFSGSLTQTASTASFGGVVGIGTTTPTQKVHIDEGILRIENSNPDLGTINSVRENGIRLDAGSTSNYAEIRPYNGTNNTTIGLSFWTSNSTPTEVVRIQPNGDVGIGTNTPSEKLEVDGNTIISGSLNVTASFTASGLNYPATDGVDGQVLKTDGNGVLFFENVISASFASTASYVEVTPSQFSIPPITITGSLDVNWELANVFEYVMTSSVTMSFSSASNGQTIVLSLTQDTTGSRTIDFTPLTSSLKWSGGTSPTLTTTTSSTDVFTFININGTYFGSYILDFR